MSKRKPRITPARQGGAFDGVFDPPAPDEAATAQPSAKKKPTRRPGVPQPGDSAHDRTVQANWNVPAWLRAKVRAVKDFDGTSQNEVVAAALERYVAELEEGRGEPYPVQSRHFE